MRGRLLLTTYLKRISSLSRCLLHCGPNYAISDLKLCKKTILLIISMESVFRQLSGPLPVKQMVAEQGPLERIQ